MNHKICIIGLGYVGLPLAVEFSKKYKTVGFDVNELRVQDLNNFIDTTNEISSEKLKQVKNIIFTSNSNDIKECNTYIVTVPTPINEKTKTPNLKFLKNASKVIGSNIQTGDLVIYESTVYPGCTLEDCIPIIEKQSGLKLNEDFYCGYSPERINPGDRKNTLTSITKIVSGSNKLALDMVDKLYSSILSSAKTYKVSSIEVAEAAKVIENTQRDLNIAFVNELALIFEKMGIDTTEVIDAASTKWNFIPFKPGLVGGHCIGVDPYYLTYKARSKGYYPEIILSGRRLNDSIGKHIANRIIKQMISESMIIESSSVLIMGFTFKEDCPDIRNTKVIDIVEEFNDYKVNVDVYDPWASKKDAYDDYGVTINNKCPKKKYDAVILAVSHDIFLNDDVGSLIKNKSIIFDIKSFLPNKINNKIVYKL